MLMDALLAIGLLFSTFTQFRLANLPVGIGEICLLIWLIPALGQSISRVNDPLPPPFLRLATFWLLIATALCIGQIVSVMIGAVRSHSLILHDVLAYVLAAGISLSAVFQPQAGLRLYRTIVVLVCAGSIVLAVQLLQAADCLPDLGVRLWFYDRLTGWTTNSNQLALLCLVLVMLSLHLAERAEGRLHRSLAITGAVLPAVAGYLTRSDAFVLAIGIALAAFAALALRQAARVVARPASTATLSLALLLLASPLLTLSVVPLPFGRMAAAPTSDGAKTESRQRIERDMGYRTALLAQALERSVESVFMGLGPGPHLDRPASLREPKLVAGPDFEAHNTPVDLLLQGGLLSVTALGWLAFVSVRETSSASMTSLALLVIVIGVFGLTHNIIRHPTVWFVVACSLALPTGRNVAAPLHRIHRGLHNSKLD